MTYKTLLLDADSHAARMGNRNVALGDREYNLLAALVEAQGAVVSNQRLLRAVWGPEEADLTRLRLTVTRLRRKLGQRACIETIVGEGYRLARDPENNQA